MTQYHVSAQAAKTNGAGSAADPFLTIGQAAAIARAGDEVVVHAGTYRESVDPRFGGESATNRIVYRAAAGEPRPVITGSERIDTWQPEGDGVWKAVIPNAFFNGYNPYVETVFGDWTVYPDPKVEVRHLGDVYLNGKSFYEVASLDKVRNPQRWDTGRDAATDSIVPLIDPDATVNVWCCAVDDEATTIYWKYCKSMHTYATSMEILLCAHIMFCCCRSACWPQPTPYCYSFHQPLRRLASR